MSRKKPRKARISGTPIVLPGSFGTKSAQDAAAQTKQIQELIDLLKRNHLTELEIERAGVRIRVRHEIGIKTVSASVSEPGQASAPAVSSASRSGQRFDWRTPPDTLRLPRQLWVPSTGRLPPMPIPMSKKAIT